MPHPETVIGEPNPDRVPTTAGWGGAPDDRRFAVSPLVSGLMALDSSNFAPPTITGDTTPPDGVPDSRLPTINGYRILGVVGRGGMGTVYKALHLELNKIVALKIVHPGGRDDSTLRIRFEREFRSLASIEHPNIVPVFDAGNWQGFPYFTMKYIPAGALSQHLERFRADPIAGGRLVAKVARAVQHLHEAGVLHRDLKPLNILIGDGDEPLVADFGLAKWMDDDSELSVTGMPMGTRQYMSPEQSLGKKTEYTPACDIWALGIILYEVIAGQRPFGSDDPVELYTQIRSGDPPSMTKFNERAPLPLEGIARRCLAKRPEDRYISARDVAEDLERWLRGDATTELLPPVNEPKRRRTHLRATVAILATSALLLIAYRAWLWGNYHEESPPYTPPMETKKNNPSSLPDEWTDLLALEPRTLKWPERGRNNQNRWDAENHSLTVSCDDLGLIAMGRAKAAGYSFTVTMQQHPWTGNAGFFLGYQCSPPENAPGNAPTCRYQVLELTRSFAPDGGQLHRLDWKTVKHEGPLGRQRQVIDNLASSPSFRLSPGEHRVKVTVGTEGLVLVTWDENVLPGLKAIGVVRPPSAESYAGDFGAYVSTGNGVFRDAFFNQSE